MLSQLTSLLTSVAILSACSLTVQNWFLFYSINLQLHYLFCMFCLILCLGHPESGKNFLLTPNPIILCGRSVLYSYKWILKLKNQFWKHRRDILKMQLVMRLIWNFSASESMWSLLGTAQSLDKGKMRPQPLPNALLITSRDSAFFLDVQRTA